MKTIGRYEILGERGRGGMAIVYKAHDPKLDRVVAIKLIQANAFAANIFGHIRARFEREARALARLDHPNIVKVLDYGEHEEAPYLVMEYLEGATLKDVKKPLRVETAVRLIRPIAEALAYVHSEGLLHRDVKPSNIIITKHEKVMLTDFGIAKWLEEDEDQKGLTGTGVGVGTPEYMAPEQGLGKKTDGRADEYSLSIVFYELITGRKPFTGDTPLEILMRQASEPVPDPREFNPELSESVKRFMDRALAKKPEDRYAEMKDYLRDLDGLRLQGLALRAQRAALKKDAEATGQGTNEAAAAKPESADAASAARTTAKDAAAPDRSGVMTIPVSQTAVEVLPTDSAESGDSSVMLRMSELRTVRAAAEMATVPAESAERMASEVKTRPSAPTKVNRSRYPIRLMVLALILVIVGIGFLVKVSWKAQVKKTPNMGSEDFLSDVLAPVLAESVMQQVVTEMVDASLIPYMPTMTSMAMKMAIVAPTPPAPESDSLSGLAAIFVNSALQRIVDGFLGENPTVTPTHVPTQTLSPTRTPIPTKTPAPTKTAMSISQVQAEFFDREYESQDDFLRAFDDAYEKIKQASKKMRAVSESSLSHMEDDYIETYSPSTLDDIRNFILEASFINPYDASFHSWDYGVLFRDDGPNSQYRLVVDSDGDWALSNHTGSGDAAALSSGSLSKFYSYQKGEKNTLKLIVTGSTGLFFVNDQFVSWLNLSDRTNSGQISLGTGFMNGHEVKGYSTRFEDLAVWKMTGNLKLASGDCKPWSAEGMGSLYNIYSATRGTSDGITALGGVMAVIEPPDWAMNQDWEIQVEDVGRFYSDRYSCQLIDNRFHCGPFILSYNRNRFSEEDYTITVFPKGQGCSVLKAHISSGQFTGLMDAYR